MAKVDLHSKSEFSDKIQVLENAKRILKTEFIGIDSIIDEIVENIKSWYILSELQDRPVIINLWGLTGTGKTSLVLRLMELIAFSERTFRFDLGDKNREYSIRNTLIKIAKGKDNSPIAIVLDEFQYAKTVSTNNFDRVDLEDENRIVWDILDSGTVSFTDYWTTKLSDLEELSLVLSALLNKGVKVENGHVTNELDLFKSEMDFSRWDEDDLFFPEKEYDKIIELAGAQLGIVLKCELKDLLMQFDGEQTIDFLNKVLALIQKPFVKKFSNAVVFVLGNIDEAYTMASNNNADLSADEFHSMSLKITVPHIKTALQERFRNEQIARLGNTHIIYPAFNTSSFRKLIRLELNRISKYVKQTLNIEFEYDESLVNEIYKEGVYPTQGARPVITTVNQLIKNKLPQIIYHTLDKELKANKIVLSSTNAKLVCRYYSNMDLLDEVEFKLTYKLESLREPKKDDLQAVVAVHEAGHAILSISLLKLVPEYIISVASDDRVRGLVSTQDDTIYMIRKDVLPSIAAYLGGLVAEELVFGEENLTSGSSSDINRATEILTDLFKFQGFGKLPVCYSVSSKSESFAYHKIGDVEYEIASIIQKAKQLAYEELRTHKTLLLQMANVLADKSKIEKDEICELVVKHSNLSIPNPDSKKFYRKRLKQMLDVDNLLKQTVQATPVYLNKEL